MADNKLLLEFDVNDKGSVKFKKIQDNINGLENKTNKLVKSNKTLDNSLGDTLKTVVGLGVAYQTLNTVYRNVLVTGFNYNKVIEQQTSSLTTLLSATSSNVDSLGNVLTAQEKYTIAQKESISVMSELEDINKNTPNTLGETAKIYKTMLPSMRAVGATQEDLIKLTEKLSIAGGAAGVEFNSLLAGVDGLATGTVLANSDLGRFLSSIGLTNKALKGSDNVVKTLINSLDGFKALDTIGVATSNLNVQWETLTGKLAKPIFEDAKTGAKGLAKYLEQVNGYLDEYTLKNLKLNDISKITSEKTLEKAILLQKEQLRIIEDEFYFSSRNKKSDIANSENIIKFLERRLKLLDKIGTKASLVSEQGEVKTLDTTIQISIADESWDEMDAEIEKEVDRFSVKDIKLSFVPQEQQIRDFVTEFESALNRFPDNLNEVNTFYLAKYKSITQDDQKEQSKLNDDMNDRINNAISSSITNAIVDGINGSSLEDTIKGLAQSIGAQVTEAGTSALVGGAVGGFAAANPATAIALGVGLTAMSAMGSGGSSGPSPQELANNQVEEFVKQLKIASKTLENFGSTGSSLSGDITSLSKELSRLREGNIRDAFAGRTGSTFQISEQKSTLDARELSFRKQMEESLQSFGIDTSGITTRRDNFGGLSDYLSEQATQDIKDLIAGRGRTNTNALEIGLIKEQLNKVLTETLGQSLSFESLNSSQLSSIIGDFDPSAYINTLTQINDLAIKAKKQGGTLTEEDKNTLIELYTLPNFIKGQDYAPAIEALKELNETLFDMTQTANEWELDLFSLGKTQKEISALRITQVQEEKIFLAEQLPELNNLTASNFISLYEMIDPSNTDLIESYEEYADLLVEQANLTFEFNQAIESMGDSITNTINTIKGNMLDDTDTSDLIKRYNDTQRIIQFQASQGVDTSDYVTELNSLAKSISGSAFGDATNLNTNLINTLEQTRLDIGFQDEIINVNIVSSDLTVTDTAVPSVFVTNTATNDSERALNIEAIQTELLINQKNIYKLLQRIENDGIKTI